ncbi:hypothetical protein BJ978_000695 [Agromyces terreus]|uniref:DUF4430 domain-containing protein n=1 Tax=Agromyces terreus TaxID=424795 RepID=A0A9X2H5Z1_9MICO|nr:hypothetical protein [Agromyces terreus]MCP2370019.1 hypothetical protein [Agromyces terreus]
MTTISRATAATAALLLTLTLAACSTADGGSSDDSAAPASASADSNASGGDCAGVAVVVETADLGLSEADSPAGSTCIDTDAAILASDAVAEAGLTTEGTDEYGDQVVCRVNGVPAADFALTAEDGSDYFETCASMPAAFAYWSLWTKPADGEWGYAEEGLSTLELEPGESLELLFTVNGEPAAPTA